MGICLVHTFRLVFDYLNGVFYAGRFSSVEHQRIDQTTPTPKHHTAQQAEHNTEHHGLQTVRNTDSRTVAGRTMCRWAGFLLQRIDGYVAENIEENV